MEPGRRGFRHDINGLRAIAVLEVLLFHLGIAGFSGGFSGVDVFYGISGFLMTQIIWGRLDVGGFSVWGFYQARARRIVPALTVLCAVLMLGGYFLLDPIAYETLGRNALSSLTFVSNILYWRQSGYFEPEAARNILLHTWSLSVEWQFYLIYPVILLLLRRFSLRRSRQIILLACAFSLALSALVTPAQPSIAFYLLPTRAWEMLLGGLVFLYPLPRQTPGTVRAALVLLGLAAIAGSIALFDDYTPWPSYRALPAVLGTCCVLAASCSTWRWCRNPVVSIIGKISYSIYLWHWPIIVIVKYCEVAITPTVIAAEIAGTLLAAWLSHHFIETGAWRLLVSAPRTARIAAPSVFAAVLVGALVILVAKGFPERHGLSAVLVADYQASDGDWSYRADCLKPGSNVQVAGALCQIGTGGGDHRILVIGDSFAEQLSPRFVKLARSDPTLSIHFFTLGGCPPVPGVELLSAVGRCGPFVKAAYAEAQTGHYDTIVIASVWAPYFYIKSDAYFNLTSSKRSEVCIMEAENCIRKSDEAGVLSQFRQAFDALGDILARLHEQGRRVVLVLPTPYEEFNPPQDILKRLFLRRPIQDLTGIDLAGFKRKTAYVDDELRRVAQHTGAVIVDPTAFLCQDGICPTIEANRRSIYKDQAHIRSSYLARMPFIGLDDLLLGQTSRTAIR